MSDKPIQEHSVCYECESEYKVTFKESATSGFPRFCPFCGGVIDNKSDDDDDQDIDKESLYDE